MNQFSTLAFVTIFFYFFGGGVGGKLTLAQQPQSHALPTCGGFGSLAWGWGAPKGAPLELGGSLCVPRGSLT